MEIVLKSIKGRVRDKDEDSVFGTSCSLVEQDMALERSVLALADGMGGGGAGEVASRMLVEAVRKHLAPLIFEDAELDRLRIDEKIQASVAEANANIRKYAKKSKIEIMGTTAVIAFVDGWTVVVGNVGDSRLYIVNEKEIKQVTRDHSYVQQLFEDRKITRDQMRKHPKKNLITKAVGLDETVVADVTRHRIFQDERLLLCCDGLWESMPDDDIRVMAMENDHRKAVNTLVDVANTLDGTDNISVVLGVPSFLPIGEAFINSATKALVAGKVRQE